MSKPLVSIVIPCFNVAETVAETIASVTAQTMQNFEIIAVDNNCSDDTARILTEIANDEPRLRIIPQPVQGLSAARNGGISAARGEFIALLDADDLWDRDFLESHLAKLADERIGISFSRVRMIDIAGRLTGQVSRPQITGLTATDLLRSNPASGIMVVARAGVFDKAGLFDKSLKSIEDQEWLFRAAVHGVRVEGIGRVLASYRITPGAMSSNLEKMLTCYDDFLDTAARIAPELVANNRRLARAGMLRYCARRAMEHNKGARVARSYLRRMFHAAPDLALREPLQTSKVLARVFLPSLKTMLAPRNDVLRTERV